MEMVTDMPAVIGLPHPIRVISGEMVIGDVMVRMVKDGFQVDGEEVKTFSEIAHN